MKIANNPTAETIAFFVGEPDEKHRVETYEKVAGWLNKIAHKEDRPWTWRYVLSVQTGTVKPSEKFICAVEQLWHPKPKAPLLPEWQRRIKRKIAMMAKQTREDLGLQKGR